MNKIKGMSKRENINTVHSLYFAYLENGRINSPKITGDNWSAAETGDMYIKRTVQDDDEPIQQRHALVHVQYIRYEKLVKRDSPAGFQFRFWTYMDRHRHDCELLWVLKFF